MSVKYSICITNFNSKKTIERSLKSIFDQIDESFEVIVVDSRSNDGSELYLRDMARSGSLKLIETKCSRGKGRQLALEKSEGTYIIAHMDMDEVFRPVLKQFLNLYHHVCDGKILVATDSTGIWRQNITVGPRDTIMSLGGWRDLQFAEDWDLWSRAAQRDLYRWTVYDIVELAGNTMKVKGLRTFTTRVARYRDQLRLGRKIFTPAYDTKINLHQRLALIIARIVSNFYESYRSDFNKSFACSDKEYLIPSAVPT
ncbi:MAG: glycosyltransferase family A protein [Conexivisphaerales archaeon]